MKFVPLVAGNQTSLEEPMGNTTRSKNGSCVEIIDCAAAACYYLMELRHNDQFNIDLPKSDFSKLYGSRNGGGAKKSTSPFSGRRNPFAVGSRKPFS